MARSIYGGFLGQRELQRGAVDQSLEVARNRKAISNLTAFLGHAGLSEETIKGIIETEATGDRRVWPDVHILETVTFIGEQLAGETVAAVAEMQTRELVGAGAL